MQTTSAEVVICGAGIAGIAAAYYLSEHGVRDILIVDERPPLSLTSDKSTECYRNFWPDPDGAMLGLMNRSIDLLEGLARRSNNVFLLNRRGYLYATADPARIDLFRATAEAAAVHGAGLLRVHAPGALSSTPYTPAPPHGFEGHPDGADLLLDQQLIRQHFSYLSQDVIAVLHARRCGWLSAQQLGMYLLEQARERGVRLLNARVAGLDIQDGQVRGVRLSTPEQATVVTSCFVNAAGPLLREVGQMAGVDLPVFSERHTKLAFNDHLGAIAREVPMLIWADPIELAWEEEERALLEEAGAGHLLHTLPAGAHLRPEGGPGSSAILALWAYDAEPVQEVFPPPLDPHFPEIVLRGIARMIPAMESYIERPPRPTLDGGYYTKTRENRPLIGPLPLRGAYVLGALSGYGIMAACGAAELLAAQITQKPLPAYAPAFALARYDDPAYLARLESWGDTGQL